MGISHSWDGTVLTITSDSGTSSADLKGDTGVRGPQGIAGADGQLRFEDLTEEQKQSLQFITNTSQLINDGDGDTVEKYLGEADVKEIMAHPEVYEFIQSYYVQETTTEGVTFKMDNGNASIVDCTKPMRVVIKLPGNTTLSNSVMAIQFSFSGNRSAVVRATNWKTSSVNSCAIWDVTKKQGYWWFEVNPYDKQVTTITGDLTAASETDMLRYIKVMNTVPAGTDISIWGTPK